MRRFLEDDQPAVGMIPAKYAGLVGIPGKVPCAFQKQRRNRAILKSALEIHTLAIPADCLVKAFVVFPSVTSDSGDFFDRWLVVTLSLPIPIQPIVE